MTTERVLGLLVTLALAVGGVGCSSDGDDGGSAAGSDTTAAATTTTTEAADDMERPPFSGAAQEVAVAYQTFFSTTASDEERLARIETTPQTEAVLAAAAAAAGQSEVVIEVTGVAVAGEVAEVEFTLTVGTTPLPGLTGMAVQQEGTWKVALATLCSLLRPQGSDPPECAQVQPPATA